MASGKLRVFLDGTAIGELEQSAQGRLSFTYDVAYRDSAQPTPLSLSMPIAGAQHKDKAVRAYLDGLLPDSPPVRERWGRQYQVPPNNPFGLLEHVGHDAAGAVQVLPLDTDPSDAARRSGDIEWLDDEAFIGVTRDLAEHADSWDPGRFAGQWSLAGAQPKIALFRDPASGRFGIPRDSTPTNCIIKPAMRAFEDHHINEALCLRAAAEAGLRAAAVDLVEVADTRAVISHRYDRTQDAAGAWRRIHQEDLCQALAVHPSLKYQSQGGPGVAAVGALLSGLSVDDRQISAERFVKGLAFNVLIGGTDAHAKNYSLILIGDRAQLAPLYDVASAACYPQYERLTSAMKVGDHWKFLDVGTADWTKVARQLDLAPAQVLAWVDELRERIPRALEGAVAGLPPSVQERAHAMSLRIAAHAEGRWEPDLGRDPRYVID